MKELTLVLMIIFVFAGCAKQNIPNYESVDNIAVFYGVSSYAMFGAEQTVMDDLYEELNTLTFEKTESEIDIMTAFSLNFTVEGEGVKSFTVDEKGTFWLDGETQCYKIEEGSFDYDHLMEIYEASKK